MRLLIWIVDGVSRSIIFAAIIIGVYFPLPSLFSTVMSIFHYHQSFSLAIAITAAVNGQAMLCG
ncbi:hypothetical protein ACSS6W_009821 [Trichoderma asperelloides]